MEKMISWFARISVGVLFAIFANSANAQLYNGCPTSQETVSTAIYTLLYTDSCFLVNFSSNSNITVTLPASNLFFQPGKFETDLYPTSGGTLTLVAQTDPDSGMKRFVNNQSSVSFSVNQAVKVRLAQDANWYAIPLGVFGGGLLPGTIGNCVQYSTTTKGSDAGLPCNSAQALTSFAGVKCNGTADDSAAIQTGLNATTFGTTIFLPYGKTCYLASSITIPAGITVDLNSRSVGVPANNSYNSLTGGTFYLGNGATIKLGTNSAGIARIQNGYIINQNLPALPASQSAALTAINAFAGTAIAPQGGDWYADNLLIVGFAKCIDASSVTVGRGQIDHIKGDCTNGILMGPSADVDFGSSIEFGNFFAPGMPDDAVTLNTNNTTASGNATLHFASVPSTVKAGQYIIDISCFASCVPVGTTVLSTTATTVVMSANATGSGVGNGDQFTFGGFLAERRQGTCISVAASAITIVAPTCVGYDTGIDFYNASGVLYQPRVFSGHIDSYYYFQTNGVVQKAIRVRGSVDGARVVGVNLVNYGIGISAETGGSIIRSEYIGIYTNNNQTDLIGQAGSAVTIVDSLLHEPTGIAGVTTTPFTMQVNGDSLRFVGNDVVGIAGTLFSVGSVPFLATENTQNDARINDYFGIIAAGTWNGVTVGVPYGGTGDTGTAWTSYTPVLSCGSGTLTSASATGRYKTLGKTVFVQVSILITTNGTCATNIQATLPFLGNGAYLLAGREGSATGKALNAIVATTVVIITNYDNTYPGADGGVVQASGVYESQ